jgi:F-type H+-transporting ATPase subunit delta
MSDISRRLLARYAVDELLAGQKTATISKRLAAVLLTSRRANQAESLLADIAAEMETRGLAARATVTSAHKLSANLRREIAAAVKKAVRVKRVDMDETVDANVLGGIRVETANHAWDKTVRKNLNDIMRSFDG